MAGRKFIDIGANLTDPMFFGIYYAKSKHPTDLKDVIERARSNGVEKIIITGSSLRDSEEALNIAKTDENLFCTVGCHPTSCKEFHQSGDPEKYLADLGKLAQANKGKVVAIGECGLDYDRLHFCPKEIQLSFFEQQLQLVGALRLPVFLHCRSAFNDLLEVLNYKSDVLCGGVVHSFDGTKEDAQAILDLGYYIGINGCSLKTQRNLEVMATIPSERLMIETDAPWCEVRPSHAGYKYVKTEFETVRRDRWKQGKMVKGRSEPSHIKYGENKKRKPLRYGEEGSSKAKGVNLERKSSDALGLAGQQMSKFVLAFNYNTSLGWKFKNGGGIDKSLTTVAQYDGNPDVRASVRLENKTRFGTINILTMNGNENELT